MKFLTTCALAALIAFPALSAERLGKNDRPFWNPPARYDHAYEGKLIEHRLPQQAVRRYCDRLHAFYFGDVEPIGQHARGCAIRKPGYCIIVYIDRPYGLSWPEAVRRHEIGHCNGWSGKHPD